MSQKGTILPGLLGISLTQSKLEILTEDQQRPSIILKSLLHKMKWVAWVLTL